MNLNGLVKDYNPPGGIDAVGTINFNPLSQDWVSGASIACPQGFATANTWGSVTCHLLGSPSDSGIPNTGVNRGNFVGGTSYNLYDIVTDTGDGLVYVAKTATSNPTAPHLNLSQWALITWNGFSPRSRDAGYYGSVRRVGDASRWFSTEQVGRATSGNVEPSMAPGTSALDGGIYWTRFNTFKGPWAATTAYSIGDYIEEDTSFWRCSFPGTSGGVEPNWTIGGPAYGNTVSDGPDILWQRRYVVAGNWTALTKYGLRVVASGPVYGSGGNDVRFQAVKHSDGVSILAVTAMTPTDGVTGSSEPGWAAASGTPQFWEDFAGSGTIIWRNFTFAVNPSGLQNERLVLTGLAAPSTVGKLVTIGNAAAGGSLIDVVLADKNGLEGTGVVNLTGTDKVSVKPFSFGGTNIRIAEGGSQIVKYDGTNWVVGP